MASRLRPADSGGDAARHLTNAAPKWRHASARGADGIARRTPVDHRLDVLHRGRGPRCCHCLAVGVGIVGHPEVGPLCVKVGVQPEGDTAAGLHETQLADLRPVLTQTTPIPSVVFLLVIALVAAAGAALLGTDAGLLVSTQLVCVCFRLLRLPLHNALCAATAVRNARRSFLDGECPGGEFLDQRVAVDFVPLLLSLLIQTIYLILAQWGRRCQQDDDIACPLVLLGRDDTEPAVSPTQQLHGECAEG
mmetsp:Transcript_34288/g.84928  ORF Transcript_34288/g.84928 Transcript_34288/m.84928 type:complete len:249 (+) Transcript_34288:600-1346(+)